MNKIAAAVIVFFPHLNVLKNIISYQKQVDKIFIFDNTEGQNDKIFMEQLKVIENVDYFSYNSNIGIASALNHIARIAISEGFHYLLTMDQDSSISDNLVEKMLIEFSVKPRIGIISPFVVHIANPNKPTKMVLEEVTTAMTSGSIVRLSAFQEGGGYMEKLFIDYVDNEFCLRLKRLGYFIMKLNSVYLYHNLGNTTTRNLGPRKVFPTNHSPLRWYYRTRNRLYVYEKYKLFFPEYVKSDKILFIKDFIKVLLFEEKKIEKIKMILLGFKHYKNQLFGKFDNIL